MDSWQLQLLDKLRYQHHCWLDKAYTSADVLLMCSVSDGNLNMLAL